MVLRKRKSGADTPKDNKSDDQVKAKVASTKKVRRKTAVVREARTAEDGMKLLERKRKRGEKSGNSTGVEKDVQVTNVVTKWADAVKVNMPASDLAEYAERVKKKVIGGVTIPEPRKVREVSGAVTTIKEQEEVKGVEEREEDADVTTERVGDEKPGDRAEDLSSEEEGGENVEGTGSEDVEALKEAGGVERRGVGERTKVALQNDVSQKDSDDEDKVHEEDLREAEVDEMRKAEEALKEAERREEMEQEKEKKEEQAKQQREERERRKARERTAEMKVAQEKMEKMVKRKEDEERNIVFKVARELEEVEEMAAEGWERLVWLQEKHPKAKMKPRHFNFLLGRLHGAITEEVDGLSVDRAKMEQVLQEFVTVKMKNQALLKFTQPEFKKKCMEVFGASVVDLLTGDYRKAYLRLKSEADAVEAATARTGKGEKSARSRSGCTPSAKGDENRQQTRLDNTAPEIVVSGMAVRARIARKAAEEGVKVVCNLQGGEQQLVQVASLERISNEGLEDASQLMEGMVTSAWLSEAGFNVMDLGTSCGIIEAYSKGVLQVRNVKAGCDLVRKRVLKVFEMEGGGPESFDVHLAGGQTIDLAALRGKDALAKLQTDLRKGDDSFEMEGVVAVANAMRINMVYVEAVKGEIALAEVELEGSEWGNAVLCVRVGKSFACTMVQGDRGLNEGGQMGTRQETSVTMTSGVRRSMGNIEEGQQSNIVRTVPTVNQGAARNDKVSQAGAEPVPQPKSHAEMNREVKARLDGKSKSSQGTSRTTKKDSTTSTTTMMGKKKEGQEAKAGEPTSALVPLGTGQRVQAHGGDDSRGKGGESLSHEERVQSQRGEGKRQASDDGRRPKKIRIMNLEVKELNEQKSMSKTHSLKGEEGKLDGKPRRSLGEGSKVSLKGGGGKIGRTLTIEVSEGSVDLINVEALHSVDTALRRMGNSVHLFDKEQLTNVVIGAAHNRNVSGTSERVDQEVQLMAIPQLVPGETMVAKGEAIISQVCKSGEVLHMVDRQGSTSARAANRSKITAEIMCDGSWDETFPSFESDCPPRVGHLVPAFHYDNRFRYSNENEYNRVWETVDSKEFRPGEPYAAQLLEEVNLSYEFVQKTMLPIADMFVRLVLEKMERREKEEIKDTLIFIECDAKRCKMSRAANERQPLHYPQVKTVLWHNYSRLAYMRKTGKHAEGDMYELLAHCCETIEEAGTDTLGSHEEGDMRVLHGWVPLLQGSDSLDECVKSQGGRVIAAIFIMPVSVPNFKLEGLSLEVVINISEGARFLIPGKEKRLSSGKCKILCFIKETLASEDKPRKEGDSDTEQAGSDQEEDEGGNQGGEAKMVGGADYRTESRREQREDKDKRRDYGTGGGRQGKRFGNAWGVRSEVHSDEQGLERRERQSWEELPAHLANKESVDNEAATGTQGEVFGLMTGQIRVGNEDVVKSAKQIEEELNDGSAEYREMVDNNATDSMNIEMRRQNVSQLEEMRTRVFEEFRNKNMTSSNLLKLLGEARRARGELIASSEESEERATALKHLDQKITKLDEAWFANVYRAKDLALESERVSKEIAQEMGMIKMLVALIAGRRKAFRMTGEWKEWQDKAVRSRMATLEEDEGPRSAQASREAPGLTEDFVIRRPSDTHNMVEERELMGGGLNADAKDKGPGDEGVKEEMEQRSRLMQEKWERMQEKLWKLTLEKNGKAEGSEGVYRELQGREVQAEVPVLAQESELGGAFGQKVQGQLSGSGCHNKSEIGGAVGQERGIQEGEVAKTNEKGFQEGPHISGRSVVSRERGVDNHEQGTTLVVGEGDADGKAPVEAEGDPEVPRARRMQPGDRNTKEVRIANSRVANQIRQLLACPRCIADKAVEEFDGDIVQAMNHAHHLNQMRLYAIATRDDRHRGGHEASEKVDEDEGPLPIVSFTDTDPSFLDAEARGALSAAVVSLGSQAGKTLHWMNGEELYNAGIEAVWQGSEMPEGDEQCMWFMARPADALGEVFVEEGETETLGACRDGVLVFGVESFGDYEAECVNVNDITAELTLDHERVVQKPSFLRRANGRTGRMMQAMFMEDEADMCVQFAEHFFLPLLDKLNKWIITKLANLDILAVEDVSEFVIAEAQAVRSVLRRVANETLAYGEFGHPMSPQVAWRDFSRYAYIKKEEEPDNLGVIYEVLADDINGINGRGSMQNCGLRDDSIVVFHGWVSETLPPSLIQNLLDKQACCMGAVFVTLKRKESWSLSGYELISEITLENVAAMVMGNEGQPIKAPLKVLVFAAEGLVEPVTIMAEVAEAEGMGVHPMREVVVDQVDGSSDNEDRSADYQEGDPLLGWNQVSVMEEVGGMRIWCDNIECWGPDQHIVWALSSEWCAAMVLAGNRRRTMTNSLVNVWSACGLWEVSRIKVKEAREEILAVGKVKGSELVDKKRLQSLYSTNTTASRVCACQNGLGGLLVIMSLEEAQACIPDLVEGMGWAWNEFGVAIYLRRQLEEVWRREVISFVNRINNGEEWQRMLESEWERLGMKGDVVASDITAPPEYAATIVSMSRAYRHEISQKIKQSKINHGKTCADHDKDRECHMARELYERLEVQRGGGGLKGDNQGRSAKDPGSLTVEALRKSEGSEGDRSEPNDWNPEDLLPLLEAIGAVKHTQAHPKRKDLLKAARTNWTRGRVIHGAEEVNDTDPEAWLTKGYKVDFGDGSAKEAVRFIRLRSRASRQKRTTKEGGRTNTDTQECEQQEDGTEHRSSKGAATQSKGWNVGTGVHCMSNSDLDLAFRVPPSKLAPDPTIAVGEGMAIMASWTGSYINNEDKQRSVYFGDAEFWVNWLLNNFRSWLAGLAREGIGKFGKIKLLIALLALLMAKGPAVVKCRGHAKVRGNIIADAHANLGRKKELKEWSVFEKVDWDRLKDFLVEATSWEGEEGASSNTKCEKSKLSKQGEGEMLRYERVCPKSMRKARNQILPILHRIAEQARREWCNRSSNQCGFEAMQQRYKQVSETIYQKCAEILGTRPDSGGGKPQVRHTKEYKEKVARVKVAAKAFEEAKRVRDRGGRVQSEVVDRLLAYAECVETSVCGDRQWTRLLQFVRERLDLEREELLEQDMSDRAVARKKSLYAASMRGEFRCLKALAMPKEEVEVLVSPTDFAEHTASLAKPPPGWIDQGVHLESITQLRARFGPPPGAYSEGADRWMLRPVKRSEVLNAWKGKKKSSKPGQDGIQYCVRMGLCNKDDEASWEDVADLDLFFIEVVREAKQTFSDWKVVRDWMLAKGGKDDYTIPKAYRNISCSVVPAKTLGFIYWARMAEWLQATNRGGSFQAFGKKKGFPGTTYTIKLLTTILKTAWHFKLNVLFIMLDLDSFYPRLVKWVLFVALTWLGVPEEATQEFMAFVGDKEAVLTKGAEIMAKYALDGVPQGCSSSVMMMVVVTILIGQQIVQADRGFVFPNMESDGEAWWGSNTSAYTGAAYADDVFAPTGGGESLDDKMPAEQVINNIKVINERLMRGLRALCLPVGLSKTIVTGLIFDKEGVRCHPAVELEVFSEKGEALIKYTPLEDIMPHLGVVHAVPEEEHIQLSSIQVEQEAQIMQMAADPDLHPKMLLDMWFISAMGKWKYVASKMDMADETPAGAEAMSKRVVRNIMRIHNLPAPCMHAAHDQFGLGLPDLEEFKVLAATQAVCSLAFSTDAIATDFFWTYICMTRRINGIGVKQNPRDFTFFDWDVDSVKDTQMKKWKWHNDLVIVLKMCRERDLMFTLTNSAITMEQGQWCLKGRDTAEESVRTQEEITAVNKAVGVVRGWRKRKYAVELKLIPTAGTLARSERAEKTLSNAWKKTGVLQLSEWDFQVKATYRMLVTPAMKHRWDKAASPVCGLCNCAYANQKHILSCCDKLKSRHYTWRHNNVLTQIKKVLCKRWQVISSEQNAIKRWIPKGVHVETRATKPDITLLNEAAGKGVLVAIVDVAVAYDEDDNMEMAEQRKIEKYEPIRKAIHERAVRESWGDQTVVEVIPLVIGTLGVVQKSWYTYMGKLLVPRDEAEALAKVVSSEAIKGSAWVMQQFNKLSRSE